jgi:hypothetical protein
MNTNEKNPLHQPETEFHGELQVFCGPALAPDDPSVQARERKGRPIDRKESAASDKDENHEQG